MVSRRTLDEQFRGSTLDPEVWLPHYLPHWSDRASSAATWTVERDGLHLSTPAEQPCWCPGVHDEPLRVSCLQTGCFAGPLGSTVGQQPFREGLVVREEQPTWWGYTPRYGRIAATMRMAISPRSMAAFWLSGIEDRPERSGEICVAEVFGDAVQGGTARVGMGVHRFRDPSLDEAFATEPLELDVAELHTYGVEWRRGSVRFEVDGRVVRTLDQAPSYPMQLMLGVFDFPGRAGAVEHAGHVPELVVTRVRGTP